MVLEKKWFSYRVGYIVPPPPLYLIGLKRNFEFWKSQEVKKSEKSVKIHIEEYK